jgi:FKBP12-rapamycin complex-associated protein
MHTVGVTRKQTLSLLGLLGALDPYKHRMNLGQIDTRGTEVAPLIPINSDDDKDKEVTEVRYFCSIGNVPLFGFFSCYQVLNKPESS